jgi:hypothetical protein
MSNNPLLWTGRLTNVKVRNTITLTDGDVMLTMTQKTIQEARTMKTITFIALIYLPASFTSVRKFFYHHFCAYEMLTVRSRHFSAWDTCMLNL